MSNYLTEKKLDKDKAELVGEKIEVMTREFNLEKYFNDNGLEYSNGACSCPWHSDSSPSLKFDNERNIFKCFACGRKGGYIKFVQLYENYIKDEKKSYYDIMDDLIQKNVDLKDHFGSIFYYEEVQIKITREELISRISRLKRKPVAVDTVDIYSLIKKSKKLTTDTKIEICDAIQKGRSLNVIQMIVEGKDINNLSLIDLLK